MIELGFFSSSLKSKIYINDLKIRLIELKILQYYNSH